MTLILFHDVIVQIVGYVPTLQLCTYNKIIQDDDRTICWSFSVIIYFIGKKWNFAWSGRSGHGRVAQCMVGPLSAWSGLDRVAQCTVPMRGRRMGRYHWLCSRWALHRADALQENGALSLALLAVGFAQCRYAAGEWGTTTGLANSGLCTVPMRGGKWGATTGFACGGLCTVPIRAGEWGATTGFACGGLCTVPMRGRRVGHYWLCLRWARSTSFTRWSQDQAHIR